MKRIGLSLGLPLVALLVGVGASRAASAHESRGHGHTATHAVRPAAAAWHGTAALRPAHGATPVRLAPPRPVHVRPGVVVTPAAGHWGWHGPRRVWFGVESFRPYAGWVWTPAQWVWDGYQWTWQGGYWAPPV
jgi:hypothetical protein